MASSPVGARPRVAALLVRRSSRRRLPPSALVRFPRAFDCVLYRVRGAPAKVGEHFGVGPVMRRARVVAKVPGQVADGAVAAVFRQECSEGKFVSDGGVHRGTSLASRHAARTTSSFRPFTLCLWRRRSISLAFEFFGAFTSAITN